MELQDTSWVWGICACIVPSYLYCVCIFASSHFGLFWRKQLTCRTGARLCLRQWPLFTRNTPMRQKIHEKKKILETICFFSYSHGTHHCGKRFIKIPFSPLLFLQQHVFIHPEHTKDSKKKYLVKTFFSKLNVFIHPEYTTAATDSKINTKKYSLKKIR